jgi:hypothetical protein
MKMLKTLLICQSLLWSYVFWSVFILQPAMMWMQSSIIYGIGATIFVDLKITSFKLVSSLAQQFWSWKQILHLLQITTTLIIYTKNYRNRSGSHLLGCPSNLKEKGITYWYLHNSKFVCVWVTVWVTLWIMATIFFLDTTRLCGKWYIHVWKYMVCTNIFWIKLLS